MLIVTNERMKEKEEQRKKKNKLIVFIYILTGITEISAT